MQILRSFCDVRRVRQSSFQAGLVAAALVTALFVQASIDAAPLPAQPPGNPPELGGNINVQQVRKGHSLIVYRLGSPLVPGKHFMLTPPRDLESFRDTYGVPKTWNSHNTVQAYRVGEGSTIHWSIVERQAELNPITGKMTIYKGGGLQGELKSSKTQPQPIGPPIRLDSHNSRSYSSGHSYSNMFSSPATLTSHLDWMARRENPLARYTSSLPTGPACIKMNPNVVPQRSDVEYAIYDTTTQHIVYRENGADYDIDLSNTGLRSEDTTNLVIYLILRHEESKPTIDVSAMCSPFNNMAAGSYYTAVKHLAPASLAQALLQEDVLLSGLAAGVNPDWIRATEPWVARQLEKARRMGLPSLIGEAVSAIKDGTASQHHLAMLIEALQSNFPGILMELNLETGFWTFKDFREDVDIGKGGGSSAFLNALPAEKVSELFPVAAAMGKIVRTVAPFLSKLKIQNFPSDLSGVMHAPNGERAGEFYDHAFTTGSPISPKTREKFHELIQDITILNQRVPGNHPLHSGLDIAEMQIIEMNSKHKILQSKNGAQTLDFFPVNRRLFKDVLTDPSHEVSLLIERRLEEIASSSEEHRVDWSVKRTSILGRMRCHWKSLMHYISSHEPTCEDLKHRAILADLALIELLSARRATCSTCKYDASILLERIDKIHRDIIQTLNSIPGHEIEIANFVKLSRVHLGQRCNEPLKCDILTAIFHKTMSPELGITYGDIARIYEPSVSAVAGLDSEKFPQKTNLNDSYLHDTVEHETTHLLDYSLFADDPAVCPNDLRAAETEARAALRAGALSTYPRSALGVISAFHGSTRKSYKRAHAIVRSLLEAVAGPMSELPQLSDARIRSALVRAAHLSYQLSGISIDDDQALLPREDIDHIQSGAMGPVKCGTLALGAAYLGLLRDGRAGSKELLHLAQLLTSSNRPITPTDSVDVVAHKHQASWIAKGVLVLVLLGICLVGYIVWQRRKSFL